MVGFVAGFVYNASSALLLKLQVRVMGLTLCINPSNSSPQDGFPVVNASSCTGRFFFYSCHFLLFFELQYYIFLVKLFEMRQLCVRYFFWGRYSSSQGCVVHHRPFVQYFPRHCMVAKSVKRSRHLLGFPRRNTCVLRVGYRRYEATPAEGLGGGGEGYSFVVCLSHHSTVDHGSLSRGSTVPTPNRDTSNI